jgi:hypothetical protein
LRKLPGLILVIALAVPTVSSGQVGRTDVPAASARLPVERFAVTPSPISLVTDVRPGAYLGVTGPRSERGSRSDHGSILPGALKTSQGHRPGDVFYVCDVGTRRLR